MTVFVAQYLENKPADITPKDARERLHRAFDILPLETILLGWNLPAQFEETIAEECIENDAQLYRWHPILTGSAETPAFMRTVNQYGRTINGYQGKSEFTFLCPNRPDVQESIFKEIESIIQRGLFKGLFLDRIRFPSPTFSLDKDLACFCEHCQLAAVKFNLDLQAVRKQIKEFLSRPGGRAQLFRCFFKNQLVDNPIINFLNFRGSSITNLVASISKRLRVNGLNTALDCFSPSLTRLVGQDLTELVPHSVWIKIMTYPRTYGPAGLPFELINLLNWLECEEPGSGISTLRKVVDLKVPSKRKQLDEIGLPSLVISNEIKLAKKMGLNEVFAGIALVQLPGINLISSDQVCADLQAARMADGVVLSWDLWHITDEVLNIIKKIYFH